MPKSVYSKRYYVFREKLVEARLAAGFSQAVLANQLGYPQSYVSKYENGERRIDIVEFLQLAEVLGIDIPAFIETLQDVPVSANIEGNANDRD